MKCPRCHNKVFPETDEFLKEEYGYYCLECDENYYEFELEGDEDI